MTRNPLKSMFFQIFQKMLFFPENKKTNRSEATPSAMQYQMQLHAQQQAWWMQQRASQMGGAPPSQYPQAQHPQVKQEAGLSTEEQQRYASLFSLMLFLHPLCLLIVFQLTVPLNV